MEEEGGGEETPGVGEETPGVGEETPGVGEETPGVGEETPGVGQETPRGGKETPRGVGDRERSGEGMFPFHLLPFRLGGRSLFTLQQFPVHYQQERERWPGLLDALITHVREEQQQLMMRCDAMLN